MSEKTGTAADANLSRLLDFFGIANERKTSADFAAHLAPERTALLGEARVVLSLLEALEQHPDGKAGWQRTVASAFVFAGEDAASLQTLVEKIAGHHALVPSPPNVELEWTVADDCGDFSRTMSGLRVVTPPGCNSAPTLQFERTDPARIPIIASKEGVALIKVVWHGVPVFLSTAPRIIDLTAQIEGRNFDLRRHFLEAAPAVMYLKWACKSQGWQTPETRACLVIDDPLLTPRYGFLRFESFLAEMRCHNFSTNIAFIPWNWRRSKSRVARLFKANPDRFSLSIHGCDHIGGEFGTAHPGRLEWKTRLATSRMERHQAQTGVRHDRVMVFPQGVFSDAAARVLKRGNFVGMVNTELFSSDQPPRPVTVADTWDTALMCYGSFPIFTRRYPRDGVENFAFDILLGKACVVVIHHNDCRGRYRELLTFIDRLNALPTRLRWCSLEEIVLHGYRHRETGPAQVEVEMFGTEMRLTNTSSQRRRFSIHKRESEPAAVAKITADEQLLPWTSLATGVRCETELDAGATKTVRILFHPPAGPEFAGENLVYRLKAAARRILCEIRDNYVVGGPFSA